MKEIDTNYYNPAQVSLTCNGDLVSEDDVEFVDIREDIMGYDVLTFTCPECGEVHESYRLT